MARTPRVTGKECQAALVRTGFRVVAQRGSHVRLRDDHGHAVTIPVHAGTILKPKTLAAILVQAGLDAERFRELL